MLDHLFLTVSDLDRSVAFYEAVLPKVGVTARHDYAGKDGPPSHADLKGLRRQGRVFFWLRQGCTRARRRSRGGSIAGVREADVQAARCGVPRPSGAEIYPPGPQLH